MGGSGGEPGRGIYKWAKPLLAGKGERATTEVLVRVCVAVKAGLRATLMMGNKLLHVYPVPVNGNC